MFEWELALYQIDFPTPISSMLDMKPETQLTRFMENQIYGFLLGTTVRNGKFYRDCLSSGKTS